MAGAGGALTPDTSDTFLSFLKKVTSYLDEQQQLDGQQLVHLQKAMSQLVTMASEPKDYTEKTEVAEKSDDELRSDIILSLAKKVTSNLENLQQQESAKDKVLEENDIVLGKQQLEKLLSDMLRIVKMASEPKDYTEKVFNDPIHGHMGFPSLCVKIIDTPQFQRLRYIKQLGGGYFVYPDASHNRFEHSLGVCHLAGLLVTELHRRQPKLGITPEDILCVQIAGLCHDLGHGPFSHVFDNKFIPAVKSEPGKQWKHEKASLDMFDHMVKENKMEEDFKLWRLEALHREFIKALIMGERTFSEEKEWVESDWYKKKEKAFLYEIVANKRNGVDVDKWDYFQRDCHHLGMTSSFDLKRFIKFARVLTVIDPDTKKEESQICYRDKEAFNMYQLFHTRFTLHRRAYQHKTVQAVELMLVDAMKEADKFLKIPKDDGTGLTISECIGNMDAYTKLTDNVFHQILLSQDEEQDSPKGHAQTRAKKILNDLQQRNLYKCVGEIVVPVLAKEFMPKKDKSPKKEIDEIKEKMMKETEKSRKDLDQMIRIQVSTLDYGKKAENPVNDVRFFKKDDEDTAVKFKAVEVSFLVPQLCFMEHLVRVYLIKGPSDESQNDLFIKQLQDACSLWCDEQEKQRYEDLGYEFKDGERKKLPGSEVPAGSAVKDHATKFGERAFLKFCPTFPERSEKKKEVIVSEPAAP